MRFLIACGDAIGTIVATIDTHVDRPLQAAGAPNVRTPRRTFMHCELNIDYVNGAFLDFVMCRTRPRSMRILSS